jgi:hypothetical protein
MHCIVHQNPTVKMVMVGVGCEVLESWTCLGCLDVSGGGGGVLRSYGQCINVQPMHGISVHSNGDGAALNLSFHGDAVLWRKSPTDCSTITVQEHTWMHAS